MQEQQRSAEENNRHVQEENQKRAQQEQKNQQEQIRQNQKIQEQNARSEQKAREDEQKRDQRDRQARDKDHYNSGGHPEPQGRPTAYRGRIPEQRFHEQFGSEHYFRVHRPVIIDNRPRFQYSGYWFELVDPWPVGWGYDDDVYVDYVDDQYYLYDPEHPGMGILISVVF
jgi:hypothetical protein